MVFSDAFVSVEVTLIDINDNSPVFVPKNQYAFTVRENNPPKSIIGKVVFFLMKRTTMNKLVLIFY